MTPQQDSLSGVIICPAYGEGQRLRVNSFTTTYSLNYTMNDGWLSIGAEA
jgi:hypothetical protein